MSTLRSTFRLIANTRQFSRSAVRREDFVPEGYKKIKLIQEKFQKPDGLPVHLKGGPMDKVLFGITASMCVVALGWIGHMLYELSNPPKLD